MTPPEFFCPLPAFSANVEPSLSRGLLLAQLISLVLLLGILWMLPSPAAAQGRGGAGTRPDATLETLNQGEALIRAGRREKAEEKFGEVLKRDPSNAAALVWLGEISLSRRDLQKAEAYAQRAERANPNHAPVHALLGTIYEQKKEPRKAESEFKKALIIDPAYLQARLLLGRRYLADGKMDQALEQYREAAKAAPDNKSVRESMVMAYLQAGRTVDALNEVKAIVPKWPKDPALRNSLGALYGRNGDSTRALQEFQEALKLDPNFAPAYLNMGDYYLALNDRPKALENYIKAGQLSPALAEASWKAGDLYLADRKIDEAIAAYRRALQANPNAVVPTINLARVYSEERPDLKQALNLAQRAEKLAPADWYVNDVLGWVQFQMGKTDEAVRLLEKARRTEPRAARPRYHLGMAYLKQGKKTAAAAELREAVALAPSLPQRAEIDKLLEELPR